MATINKDFNFSAGSTILASEHNANFNTIYNDYNGNITNANIAGGAAIANSKLNLSSISQNITFTGNNTFAGTTIADLGTVTTADIDGGTIDAVTMNASTISGTTGIDLGSDAEGDTYYRNSSGDLTRLAKGTNGQYLKIGASIPAWDDVITTTQSSASRQSATGGNSGTYSTIDTVAKTVTSGNTVFAICTLKYVCGETGNEKINFKHGSTTIQEFTGINRTGSDVVTVTLSGIVTGLSGSTTFTVEGANSAGGASSYSEVNITLLEF